MTNYCGYMGKVLLLDLAARTTENYIWTDLDREKYIGGKAMASKILYDNLTGAVTMKNVTFGYSRLDERDYSLKHNQ